ncbi:tyrosine-type recombinase/integrase [Microbacterium sp. 179-I 3D4 NHS]|uniref:tyrosine-type recombinase/integrase n=1 Tax=Microbacterium sp. 179-I 3D4 NHS TaxID=3142381 RepID=UPI0039A2EC13
MRFSRFAGDLTLAGPEEVIAYFATHPEWRPEYRKKVATSLRLFFRWAHQHDLLARDPAVGIPQVRVPRYARPPAPETSILSALGRATLHERAVLQLGASLGLRRTEIATSHPRNRDGRILTVVGKGGRSRRIPLDDATLKTLLDIEALQGRTSYYLPGGTNGHLHPCTVYKWVVRMLGPGWSTHSLRRRAGREGFQRTKNIRAVQSLLGQSSLDTTALYVHVDESEIADVTSATSLGVRPASELPESGHSLAEVIQQIADVSARARDVGLNVRLSVEHTNITVTSPRLTAV